MPISDCPALCSNVCNTPGTVNNIVTSIPRVGLADETSDELSEVTTDVTVWLSSIPDV